MKNQKLASVVGSVLLASFTLVPVSLVFANEESASVSVTAQVGGSSASSSASTTVNHNGELRDWIKEKREDLKKEIQTKRDEIKDKRDEKRDEWKNSSSTASSTERREEMKKKMEERKATMAKKQIDSATASILNLSTKLGTLGVQIKAIVEGQASTSATIDAAVSKEDGRGMFGRFLFGSDPKNLAVIIAQVNVMQARISQLDSKIGKMASSSDKVTLTANVQTLKDQVATLEQYVKDNINKFSLFGWFNRFKK